MNRTRARRGEPAGKFLRQMGRLDGELKKRFYSAMQYLRESKDPRTCGKFKRRENIPSFNVKMSVYAYEVNRSYRLIYAIHEDVVIFLCAGDHKAAYGRD